MLLALKAEWKLNMLVISILTSGHAANILKSVNVTGQRLVVVLVCLVFLRFCLFGWFFPQLLPKDELLTVWLMVCQFFYMVCMLQ